MKKLLCWVGYHNWTWKLKRGEPIDLNAPPPDRARCEHCNKRYKPEQTNRK